MNVAELIAILQCYPPERRVVVCGYEGGFDDLTAVKEQGILIGSNLIRREPHEGLFGMWIDAPADYGAGEHSDGKEASLDLRRTLAPSEVAVLLVGKFR
ncbi:MAG: hypothetical protein ACXWJZ_04900 [Burkholderiaceae bacterium]